MFFKNYYFVLILVIEFFFGDVFGSIVLIGEVGVMDIINLTNKSNIDHDAKMITMPGCFKSSTVLQCGPVAIDFVNKKKVFAEIFLNYKEQVVENPKIMINLKITFTEKYITLSPKITSKNFSYDEVGIQQLQESIQILNNKIQFKVIKIFESNLSSNRALAHSRVYDNHLKIKLDMIKNLSSWKYVKEEKVLITCSSTFTLSNITLEDFINNSTMYKKNVASTIDEAEKIMDDRTFKYACLLVVYTYMTLKLDNDEAINWVSFKNVCTQLRNAQIKSKYINNILFDLRVDFDVLKPNEPQLCQKIIECLMDKYLILFKISLENTVLLPQDLFTKAYHDFLKPPENNDISYDFTTELFVIKKKLKTIVRLITTEYSSFLSKDYKEILNDSYS
ncbi:uncharacterized protein LOC126908700 isoform X2 [Daktulosphaira vitifoliae]|uniref:uncharacterized protein LOC126908700 isoform X2 n=1 Tax=Daktulosphaira vitifoliae TaxID=58002 RepID=UPI0021AA696B|nr:uncharacterized protein LOC126908700 isoform X2 [Daktulosphaira vitifoliae]